jgi:fatty acid desaturase
LEPRETSSQELADPKWFREPTRRERWIAAALFVGFGVFFVMLFLIQSGWWFRWVILSLAGVSIFNGVRQLLGAARLNDHAR